MYAQTTQVQVLIEANLGAYFLLNKFHLGPLAELVRWLEQHSLRNSRGEPLLNKNIYQKKVKQLNKQRKGTQVYTKKIQPVTYKGEITHLRTMRNELMNELGFASLHRKRDLTKHAVVPTTQILQASKTMISMKKGTARFSLKACNTRCGSIN